MQITENNKTSAVIFVDIQHNLSCIGWYQAPRGALCVGSSMWRNIDAKRVTKVVVRFVTAIDLKVKFQGRTFVSHTFDCLISS